MASLPIETQKVIYATGPDQVFAGGLYPAQKAAAVPGGWNVTGRWRFASGCMGADWIGVGIEVEGPGGKPRQLAAVAPAAEVEIVPNWDVVGMQGTGSHDLRLDGEQTALWASRLEGRHPNAAIVLIRARARALARLNRPDEVRALSMEAARLMDEPGAGQSIASHADFIDELERLSSPASRWR